MKTLLLADAYDSLVNEETALYVEVHDGKLHFEQDTDLLVMNVSDWPRFVAGVALLLETGRDGTPA